jgi:hypothetical protein
MSQCEKLKVKKGGLLPLLDGSQVERGQSTLPNPETIKLAGFLIVLLLPQ